MKSRLIASLALGAAVILGATGCAMISPQATTVHYSPADGVNVDGSAPLEVRNAVVIANEEGTAGNLVAAIVNPTDGSLTLNLEVGDARTPATVHVPANSVVSLGAEGTPPLPLANFEGVPGSDVPIYFQSGDENGVKTDVPILDGTLPYYADLVPQPAVPADGVATP
ncbi:MAG: DNA modification methylase [Microbacterium sp.]|uniref:DNA modification methylase n=1 Tax=Microbacterium sp. TaxID=51671 RepID=UPI0039E4ED79